MYNFLPYLFILFFFRRQIMEKEEVILLNLREKTEEVRLRKQLQMKEQEKLEAMRQRKLNELNKMNVEEKFKSDLQRFKIKY